MNNEIILPLDWYYVALSLIKYRKIALLTTFSIDFSLRNIHVVFCLKL